MSRPLVLQQELFKCPVSISRIREPCVRLKQTMRILVMLALLTLLSGAYALSLDHISNRHLWVSMLHTVFGALLLVIAFYSILYPRRLP